MGDAHTRRRHILDAAVTVLAEQGLRGLTHRRVDVAAGVPLGSVSNYFPSRPDLVAAAVRHISAWITESRALTGDVEDLDAEDAVLTLFRQQVKLGMTAWRTPVLAWNRVVFELPSMPAIHDEVVEIRNGGIKAYSALLQRCGSADPERHAWLIMSFVKGILLRQYLVPDPDFDADAALRPLLDTLLHRARSGADSHG